ncbi:MAG TPA: DMT family transporter [Acidimicrobiia bacterium]|nr:DMT family transporter [Acidimicrobiia bacterium]
MSSRHARPLILAAACWGLGTVASKHALAVVPPRVLLVSQLTASVLFLAVVAIRFDRGPRPPIRAMLLGVLNPGLAYLLGLAGLAWITAGLSSMLWALEPVMVFAVAWLILGRRYPSRLVSLGAVAVLGAIAAGAGEATGGALLGVSLTMAAVLCCAVYTVVAAEWSGSAASLRVVLSQQAVALCFAFGVLGATGPVDVTGVDVGGWASALGSGILYYGLAFWAFLTGLRRTTAGVAALFLSLVPVFGVGGAWLVLAERPTPVQLAGGLVVVVAVAGSVRWSDGQFEPVGGGATTST